VQLLALPDAITFLSLAAAWPDFLRTCGHVPRVLVVVLIVSVVLAVFLTPVAFVKAARMRQPLDWGTSILVFMSSVPLLIVMLALLFSLLMWSADSGT